MQLQLLIKKGPRLTFETLNSHEQSSQRRLIGPRARRNAGRPVLLHGDGDVFADLQWTIIKRKT